jgi:hypothetical protein
MNRAVVFLLSTSKVEPIKVRLPSEGRRSSIQRPTLGAQGKSEFFGNIRMNCKSSIYLNEMKLESKNGRGGGN